MRSFIRLRQCDCPSTQPRSPWRRLTCRKRGEAEFRALLADRLSGMAAEALRVSGGAVPAPASLPAPLSSWEAAEELLQADPRYARMPERMREHAWRVWVEAALTGVSVRGCVGCWRGCNDVKSCSDKAWRVDDTGLYLCCRRWRRWRACLRR